MSARNFALLTGQIWMAAAVAVWNPYVAAAFGAVCILGCVAADWLARR